jgi:hypothetical protein
MAWLGPWLMAGAGYEHESSDVDTTETGTEVESVRGFVLQDDDGGDKFVVKVCLLHSHPFRGHAHLSLRFPKILFSTPLCLRPLPVVRSVHTSTIPTRVNR